MENTTNIVAHSLIKSAIMANAPMGIKISTKNSGVAQSTMTEWRALINDIRNAIIDYADAVQNEQSINSANVYKARTHFFVALDNVRKFSGLSFPNGFDKQDEIIVWLAYLSRAVKKRDENGKIVDMPLTIASSETVRGTIEILLYLRESGQTGMTVKQYEEEKARRKAEKAKKRAEEQKKKQAQKKIAELEKDLAEFKASNSDSAPTAEPTEKAVA